jgi:hypothetical protein
MRAALKIAAAAASAGALALMLSGCMGGGPPRPTKRQIAMIDQALSTAPGSAQPSTIVAREVAFSRLAAETTPAAAFLQYAAAPNAQVHTGEGLIGVAQWVAQAGFPTAATKWSTRAVAITCDGALAASTGRYTDPNGIIGNYVMIWQRQSDGAYLWIYHAAGPDVPQPPKRVRPQDGNITVTALDAVQGLVASCPRGGAAIPPPPALSLAGDSPSFAALARDGTLRWQWRQADEGRRYVAAEYFYEGRWLTAFEHNLAAGLQP